MASIYLHNVRSLKNKFHEIEILPVTLNNIDIIAITETWLLQTNEHLFKLNNYNAEFNSRNTRGGGIAIYIRNDKKYKLIANNSINQIQYITILTQDNTYITLIYKPPQIKNLTLRRVMENNIFKRGKTQVIIGDININILEKCNNNVKMYKKMLTENNYKIMNQINKSEYTRYNTIGENTLLDHIITNRENIIIEIKTLDTPISDHRALLVNLNTIKNITSKYECQKITKMNTTQIEKDIKNLKQIMDIKQLSISLQEIIEKNKTTYKIKRKPENPWINNELIKNITLRNKLHKKYLKNKNNEIMKTNYTTQKKKNREVNQNNKRQLL